MNYSQGYDDGYWQGRQSARYSALGGWLVQLLLTILQVVVVFFPLLIIGYWTAQRLEYTYSGDWMIKIALVALFTYLIYATLYLLKGAIIGLKGMKNRLWILLWGVCVIFTCGLQVFITQYQLEGYLYSMQIANYKFWSFAGSVAVGTFIYFHYRFLTNIAPRAVFWSYSIGFNIVKSIYAVAKTELPKRSRTFFGNAKMTVSYKK